MWEREKYEGSTVWMVCGGPSVRGFDFSQLPGTIAAINEIGCDIPNLDIWIGNDSLPDYPQEFWSRDCIKFVREEQHTLPNVEVKNFRRFKSRQQSITGGDTRIREDLFFDPKRVLWGAPYKMNDGTTTIKKSAMLMAFGVLWRLGFSEVRLLGCDWQTSLANPYGHKHKKEIDETAIRKSTLQFRVLETWFERLLPMFNARGFKVVNCTPGSKLDVFKKQPLTMIV